MMEILTSEMFALHLGAGVFGYLLGAVPFGMVAARLFGLGDLRTVGSGNIGATNVLRTGNKPAAAFTLIGDVGKGAAAALVTEMLFPGQSAGLAAGFWAVMGHNYPVWLKFKGGKGIATTMGVLVAIHWPVGLAAIGTWLLVAAVSRYSSLAALMALAAAPGYALLMENEQVALMAGLLAALAWWLHTDNIRRLVKGTETKIGQKK